MHITLPNDPGERDLKRLQLTRRLVAHQARTQTVACFTGLTRHRLSTLRKRWNVPEESRHRGPSPNSFAALLRAGSLRARLAAAAVFLAAFGVIPGAAIARVRDSDVLLAAGERLCDAYEAFLACCPAGQVEFDQFVLLAQGLSHRKEAELVRCAQCDALLVSDPLACRRHRCIPCGGRATEARATSAPVLHVERDESIEPGGQQSLF